jgi:hypothetical protein
MKDSRIARRDDDNPVVFMRRYRRANEVTSLVSTRGCRSRSRSITPHHLVLVVPGLPFIVPLLLLVVLLLLLLLRVLSSIVRCVLHLLLLPPQAVLLLKK